jgi:hypothetical protein
MLTADVSAPAPRAAWASLTTVRASVEPFEHHHLPIRRPYLRCTVCLDTEPVGDLLPGPAAQPRALDLQNLQPFSQRAQRRNRS